MKVAVILPAAGLGTRMGRTSAEKAGTSRKQFMLLDGAPILLHSVRKFAASARVDEIVVAVRREDLDWVAELLQREVRGKRVRVVEGGNSRQQSVENALAVLDPDTTPAAVPRGGLPHGLPAGIFPFHYPHPRAADPPLEQFRDPVQSGPPDGHNEFIDARGRAKPAHGKQQDGSAVEQ